MNRALLLKTLRDRTPLLVVLMLGIVALELAIARMLIELGANLAHVEVWLELPLIRNMLELILGADLLGDLTPTTSATFGLAHPMLWVLAWAMALTVGTGVLAGEMDSGTADLLLTLPISRRTVYVTTSTVLLFGTVLLSVTPLAGLWLGLRIWPPEQPVEFRRLWPVAANLAALNAAVAGVTMLVSSVVSRRGKAVGYVLGALLVSDLVNVLAQYWSVAKPISFLGFLHYYRPLLTVRSGQLPWDDILVLLALALSTWLAGLWYFCRRDIPAV